MLWSIVALLAIAQAFVVQELVEPDEIVLSNEITWLKVTKCTWDVENIVSLQTRCYCYDWNGSTKCTVPGPTLVFTNGTGGFIRLQNRLNGIETLSTGETHVAMDMISHDPDVINLHVHGLHVDPAIDDVVNRFVEPNGNLSLDYNFSILADHYPGLHWYHDHWHGAVTFHVHTGLFGAIKVKRQGNAGIDPNLAAMASRVVILHGLSLNNASLTTGGECNCTNYTDWFDGGGASDTTNPLQINGFHLTTVCDQWCDMYCFQRYNSETPPIQKYNQSKWENSLPAGSFDNWDSGRTVFLVNGQIEPKITIQRNEWLRLLLLNADAQGSFLLKFDESSGCEYYYIAADGIFFNSSRDLSKAPYENLVYLSMAGRAEVLVKCSNAGTYKVKHVSQHPNSTVENGINCNPIYLVNVTLFSIVVTSVDNGSIFDPSTLAFPEKTGYVQDTINTAEEVSTAPQCVHYNANGVNNITWEMNPDPRSQVPCSEVDIYLNDVGYVALTGKVFGLNGQYFRHDVSLATLLPDKIYEFDVTFFPHPFHHHINPFQLTTDIASGFLGQIGDWRDVLSPGCANGTFVTRTRTRDFTGNVVMHCHFLPHEDRGLMGYYTIANVSSCPNASVFPAPDDGKSCVKRSSDYLCLTVPSGSVMLHSAHALVTALFIWTAAQLL